MDAFLIAPCGMNCALCMAYQRDKKKCPGCLADDKDKNPSCVRCVVKNCETRIENKWDHCYPCGRYPCARIKQLDKRYRTKYNMSMIENLGHIRDDGMDSFLQQQAERWTCQKCGKELCVHRDYCLNCPH